MSKKPLAALILAAGQGKRMRSLTPKVLHTCGDLPLVAHVVRAALARRANPVVVVVDPKNGARVEACVRALFPAAPLLFAVQERPRGTGDAARVGLALLGRFAGRLLILYGDVPLLAAATLAKLERVAAKAQLALLTAEVADAKGYGRIVRVGAHVTRIVEDADASADEKGIREINAGVYVCDAALLHEACRNFSSRNAQGEFYLTDIVPLAAGQGGAVGVRVADPREIRGVNTRAELAEAETTLRLRLIAHHQARGVMFRDPEDTFIGADVRIAPDVEIGVGVQLYGKVKIGRGARIFGPTVVRDAQIEAGAVIAAFSHIEGARVGREARIGPFARLRPLTSVEEGAHVGNFVELKKTRLGKGAKANHLAYLGDADIGAASNIGAGTITCNYDGGPIKHRTIIGASAFVGSNTTLVAPIAVRQGAYVAAGSTLTKDVPKDALAFGRARQENRAGYAAKLRARLDEQRRAKAAPARARQAPKEPT